MYMSINDAHVSFLVLWL